MLDDLTARRLKREAIRVLRDLRVELSPGGGTESYQDILALQLGRPPTDEEVWRKAVVDRDPVLGITWYG